MEIYIADFETTPFIESNESYYLESRFICFINLFTKKRLYFNLEKNKTEIINFLNSFNTRKTARIYFHNLKFDLAFIFELIPRNKEVKYRIIRSGSRIIQFKIFKEYNRIGQNGKVRVMNRTILDIRDSLVLLPQSVEKLGLALGYPKLDIDYTMKEITNEYIEYCYRDIEIIIKSLFKLKKLYAWYYKYDLKLNNLPLTLPALSKRVFHKLLQDKYGKKIINYIYDRHSYKYESNIRKYYYGGRVEVFDFNKCNSGYYNDFNSFYAAIMKQNEFPLAPFSFKKCIDSEKCFNDWNDNYKYFGAICNVYETLDIPLVAIKINGKLIFAKGKKKCFLFRKEIEYLQSLKQKVEILELAKCNGYLPIFDDFIDITFKIKKHAKFDNFEYRYSKLSMVSLYGKFAEKREKEKIELVQSIKGISESELRYITYSNKGFLKRTTESHPTLKINIFYSMMIAALARLKLHKEIMKSKNPFYCDSDSIVTVDLIEDSKELGHLKPEFKFEKFQALGCKEYIIQNDGKISIKMKGFGKLSTESFEKFISLYRMPKKQNRMIGFMESFIRNENLNLILVYNKYKTGSYDKRWINNDLTTKPYNIDLDDFEELILNNERQIEKIINSYKKEV